MTSTTIEQASFTPANDPFEAAIKLAEQREQRRKDEEAAQAEASRAQREQQERDRQRQAFVRSAKRWVESFFAAVIKTAVDKEWKPGAITQAKAYAEALVLSASDAELPKIDPSIAQVIQSKFAYGLALDRRNQRVIPENFFNGQRQDWFPELFEQKLREVR